MKWIAAAWLCMGLAVACGGGSGDGGSGVSGSKKLVDLNDGEITKICQFTVDVAGPQRMITCDGTMVTIGGQSVNECVTGVQMDQTDNPNCAATVSQFEGCAQAISDLSDQQICDLFSGTSPPPAACAPLSTAECSN